MTLRRRLEEGVALAGRNATDAALCVDGLSVGEVRKILALLAAFKLYVEWHGGAHEADCPEDDTCDCEGKPVNDAVNESIAAMEADA